MVFEEIGFVHPTYSNLYAYAANNPVHYLDPDGREVDYVLVGILEGTKCIGYVPYDGEGQGHISGVTIATGFDLGQQNQWDLRRIFGSGETNQDLKDLFSPYLGLQGREAYIFLQNNPLVLDDTQVGRVNTCVLPAYLFSISNYYNEHVDSDHNWDTLPDQAQTVIFSIGYQFGNGGLSQELMNAISNGQYSRAADIVEAMGANGNYTERRNEEANLLRQLSNNTN